MARVSRVRAEENLARKISAKEMETRDSSAAIIRQSYKTACYVRLSVLNSGKKDSDSIETQEAVLRKYIKGKAEFRLIGVYRDNGETGVNFQRSGFERLMEDVRAGKIDCIIVKDLSRFGRNYLETGEYLEKIFPLLEVRFIAVNDGYDSLQPTASSNLSLHLKNLVNDVYARDISAKISPVLRGKQERGEFIGAWAAYGYLKSSEDKHKLVLDPKTAPIVRTIFEWRLSGLSYQKIARKLTEQKIPSPSQYRYEIGIMKKQKAARVPWSGTTVKAILENEVYLGNLVQRRNQTSLFQGQKRTYLASDEWTVVRGTHEAMIDEDTFAAVKQCNQQRSGQITASKEAHV